MVGVGVEENPVEPGAPLALELLHYAVAAPRLPVRARADHPRDSLPAPVSRRAPARAAVSPPIAGKRLAVVGEDQHRRAAMPFAGNLAFGPGKPQHPAFKSAVFDQPV